MRPRHLWGERSPHTGGVPRRAPPNFFPTAAAVLLAGLFMAAGTPVSVALPARAASLSGDPVLGAIDILSTQSNATASPTSSFTFTVPSIPAHALVVVTVEAEGTVDFNNRVVIIPLVFHDNASDAYTMTSLIQCPGFNGNFCTNPFALYSTIVPSARVDAVLDVNLTGSYNALAVTSVVTGTLDVVSENVPMREIGETGFTAAVPGLDGCANRSDKEPGVNGEVGPHTGALTGFWFGYSCSRHPEVIYSVFSQNRSGVVWSSGRNNSTLLDSAQSLDGNLDLGAAYSYLTDPSVREFNVTLRYCQCSSGGSAYSAGILSVPFLSAANTNASTGDPQNTSVSGPAGPLPGGGLFVLLIFSVFLLTATIVVQKERFVQRRRR